MEWTGGQVKVAEVVIDPTGTVVSLKNEVHIAGKKTEISAGYPSWISDDVVIFTSDISGYQNPWKYVLSTGTASPIFAEPIKEDFSEPGWILGWAFYAHVGGNFVVFSSLRNGRSQLYLVDVSSGSKTELDTPYTHIGNMRTLSTTSASGSFIFLGSKVDEPESLVKCTISLSSAPSTSFEALKSTAASFAIPKELVSKPAPMTFSLPGPNGEEPLYAIYYPPHNPEYEGSSIEGEKPPCVVNSHGGPTGASLQVLTSEIQYFTSRGWAWQVSSLPSRCYLC
jgi:dipeptidyl aminopeptidase/acylaminoacyl peptidase